MGGLACPAQASERVGEIGRSDVSLRYVAGRTVMDDAVALARADDGKRSGPGMSAAFGAARDVHERQSRGQKRRKLSADGSCWYQPESTRRRARAGNHAAARIA